MKSTHANRGKDFEELINYANAQYRQRGVALIQKVATLWTVIRKGKQIVSAFLSEKSTVDYVGIRKHGASVAFDAKQCHNKTSFPLVNIEPHQMEFLQEWDKQDGEAFLLIEMVTIRKIFKLSLEAVNFYFALATDGGSKSIKVQHLIESGPEVKSAGEIALDYLGIFVEGGQNAKVR